MVRLFTLPVVRAYMRHVQDNAAESVRRVHRPAARQRVRLRDRPGHRDQGAHQRRQDAARRHRRFHRHPPQQPTNFNAPEPVTRAAVLYVFRVMVDDDIPMNAGCLRPIKIIIPTEIDAVAGLSRRRRRRQCRDLAEGHQLRCSARSAHMAAAQGTMNNLNFGNARTNITRRSAPARRPARASPAPTPFTPT